MGNQLPAVLPPVSFYAAIMGRLELHKRLSFALRVQDEAEHSAAMADAEANIAVWLETVGAVVPRAVMALRGTAAIRDSAADEISLCRAILGRDEAAQVRCLAEVMQNNERLAEALAAWTGVDAAVWVAALARQLDVMCHLCATIATADDLGPGNARLTSAYVACTTTALALIAQIDGALLPPRE